MISYLLSNIYDSKCIYFTFFQILLEILSLAMDFPFGFIAFKCNFDFFECFLFCNDNNIEIKTFQLHGLSYIAVFLVNGFYHLIDFCHARGYQVLVYYC